MVRSYETTMRGPDAVAALYALFLVDKKTSVKTNRIYEQEDFLLLCDILKKNIRQLSVDDTVQALKAFVHFNVPSSSVIVQTILQMIRHSVNELTTQQIEFLDFLFRLCERTPIIDALTVAMPIVYERNISVELDRDNIKSMVSAFEYLSRRSKNIEILGAVINEIKNRKTSVDLPLAKKLLWSMFDIQCHPPGLSELLNDVQSILVPNIPKIDRRTIHIMMKLLAARIKSR